MIPARDTIFALSSGRPPCAIAVIRISGPSARMALEAMIGRVPSPRVAALARVRDPASGDVIDEGLALWFPGPKSETGEDVAELQVHGGRAVIAAVLGALARLEGFRHAEAGEFTRRAFENGRMDLTAVEGLADLVAAETDAQRRQALRQMQGEFARHLERWRERLIQARALLEAGIDFSDEGDVPANLAVQALEIVGTVLAEIKTALQGQGERLRDGLQIAIAGPPNVGKSTLLNRMAQRDVAIVSPYAGTTRDVIEAHLDLGGYPVTLHDTAGIRVTDDPVEQEGVRRAQRSTGAADLVLWVLDGTDVTADAIRAATEQSTAAQTQCRVLIVVNKIDVLDAQACHRNEYLFSSFSDLRYYPISAETGEGVDHLIRAIAAFAGSVFGGEPALVTRQRHRQMMDLAAIALTDAVALAEVSGADGRVELFAEEVRVAMHALERLTGRVDVEDILDVIFRDFCIGK